MLLGEKFIKEIPSYPPVVRYIFTDNYDHVWVIVGEWYIDDSEGERKINTTVEITTLCMISSFMILRRIVKITSFFTNLR